MIRHSTAFVVFAAKDHEPRRSSRLGGMAWTKSDHSHDAFKDERRFLRWLPAILRFESHSTPPHAAIPGSTTPTPQSPPAPPPLPTPPPARSQTTAPSRPIRIAQTHWRFQ